MSLLPIMLRSMGWQLRQHNDLMRHFLRQDMKAFFSPEEIKFLTSPFPSFNIIRDGNRKDTTRHETESLVNKDGFQVNLDVGNFEPDEVHVKIIGNTVEIEGKHEERPDEQGVISRHFVRKYSIPEGFNIKDLVSTLSSDGILTVKVPTSEKQVDDSERIVKIQQTGKAHTLEDKSEQKDQ